VPFVVRLPIDHSLAAAAAAAASEGGISRNHL